MSDADIDLSDALLDQARPSGSGRSSCCAASDTPAFFAEPEICLGRPPGPGYYALVRHADILEASRNPEVFCSGPGRRDQHPGHARGVRRVLRLDDQHGRPAARAPAPDRLARPSRPRMIKQFEADVRAPPPTQIVDDLLATGRGATSSPRSPPRLPLKIICDMMGIPEQRLPVRLRPLQRDPRRHRPRVRRRRRRRRSPALLTAGQELAAARPGPRPAPRRAAHRRPDVRRWSTPTSTASG